jgi:hypothetical protein
MERQYLKLMDMIAAIVGTLDKREMFQSIISHSGHKPSSTSVKVDCPKLVTDLGGPRFDVV